MGVFGMRVQSQSNFFHLRVNVAKFLIDCNHMRLSGLAPPLEILDPSLKSTVLYGNKTQAISQGCSSLRNDLFIVKSTIRRFMNILEGKQKDMRLSS